jgi:hypothetical protein
MFAPQSNEKKEGRKEGEKPKPKAENKALSPSPLHSQHLANASVLMLLARRGGTHL